MFSLEPDAEEMLNHAYELEEVTRYARQKTVVRARTIDLQIAELPRIFSVSLEKPGRQSYNLSKFTGQLHLICDI
jgi:hypothetical protein